MGMDTNSLIGTSEDIHKLFLHIFTKKKFCTSNFGVIVFDFVDRLRSLPDSIQLGHHMWSRVRPDTHRCHYFSAMLDYLCTDRAAFTGNEGRRLKKKYQKENNTSIHIEKVMSYK